MTQAVAHQASHDHAHEEHRLSKGKVGMSCLIITESFFFMAFIVAYLYYVVILQVDDGGPTPTELFYLDWLVYGASICLFSSSATVVFAANALARGAHDKFRSWLFITIVLGGLFIAATVVEWADMIGNKGMWMDTSSLGTCYFSLVGFHAFHVCVGLTGLTLCLLFSFMGKLPSFQAERFEVLSWYWHFVDTIWIFVFITVYILRVY
ncbi:MAG: heme-copper oxidase subunit III [Planctomycetota bacterium]|nr:heme-copper oxidase subunit III [Planctomycetota bacterium]MEC9157915.1 heme-copper oxidase subunit III [Planctomycetota bacterium]MEC9233430.1 heme-copper oxidase subunit III [Planctomycetota bacterium]